MQLKELMQYTIISLFILVGGLTVSAQEPADNTPLCDLAQNYYYTMKGPGEIDVAGSIYMSLSATNSNISGKYYYNKTNKGKSKKRWISVSGTVDWDQFTMRLREQNGIFIGQFERIQCGFLYYGTFVRNDGRKFDFSIELYM